MFDQTHGGDSLTLITMPMTAHLCGRAYDRSPAWEGRRLLTVQDTDLPDTGRHCPQNQHQVAYGGLAHQHVGREEEADGLMAVENPQPGRQWRYRQFWALRATSGEGLAAG